MKKKTLGFTAVLLSGLFFAGCGNSTGNAGETPKDSTMNTSANSPAASVPAGNASQSPDAKLVYELEESMYAGIALMKDGEKKATDPAVKALAGKLVMEHTKLTEELEALSSNKGWPLPGGEPDADRAKREAMGKEDVAQFQKDWLAALRERHETNSAKLENSQPSDPDVKAAGAKGLPKIKELLAEIKKVQANLK